MRMGRWNSLMMPALGLLVLSIAGTDAVRAQDKVGTTGAQFLEIGVSPRAVAMGGAFISIADDASALYYNPAGLVQLERRQIMVASIDMMVGISHTFVGIVLPGLGGKIGFAYYGLDAGDIPVTTYGHPHETEGWTFGAKDYAIGVTYARALTDRFSVGGTMKVIDELYAEERATGWAADLGTQYNTGFRNFKISMMMSNFGPDMKFLDDEYPLPINFRFGGAIDAFDGPGHHLTVAMEGSHPADNRERYNLGGEYIFQNFAALRAGYRLEYDTGSLSFGGGLNFEIAGMAARLDYGYQDLEALSEIHRFSLVLDF